MAGARAAPPRQAVLVVVCGLPGSGKTTLARRLAHERRLVRLCADDWMERLGMSLWDIGSRAKVEQLQHELVLELLATGSGVVVEWGTWFRSERDQLREAARQRGARVELHYLDAPDEELQRRISARRREDRPVTLEDVATWREFFEPPTADELELFDHERR
jgi:predicted kinase